MRKTSITVCLWLLRFALLASATLLTLCMTAQAQRTIRIPADAPTIQSGIDMSATGDIVLVAPGVYFENLNPHGKAIAVRSGEGPSVTIIDGGGIAPVVSFITHEGRATSLSGFTLRNGAPASAALRGGGVLLVDSSPTLNENVITQNQCTAVAATNSSPLLQGNTLRETQSSARCVTQPMAAAIFVGGAPVLEDNIVEHNDFLAGQPVAAGFAFYDAQATLDGNILRYNRTSGDVPSALALESTTQSATLRRNLIYANASGCGPAVLLATPGEFANNTVADNLSAATCTQPEVALSAKPILFVNNIVATSVARPALGCSGVRPGKHHNLVANSAGPLFSDGCSEPASTLSADPLFVDRPQSDYHLSPGSPAISAGVSTATGQTIDLGAYQHAAPRTLTASLTSLNVTPNPAEAFQPITLIAQVTAQNTTPTGSVVFTAGNQALSTVTLDADGRASFTSTTLAATTYVLSANYSGSATLAPSSSSLTETVSPATTLLAFAVTPSDADETQTVTLSATVEAPLSTKIPSGQVQFLQLNPGKVLATVPLDATGHASTTLPTMPTGSWLVSAIYLGTANFSPVTLPASDALTLTVANRGYVLASSASTVTVQSGHHTALDLTLRSIGTFASGITLSCANLPADTTCAFSPASPSLTAGATQAVTLTLDTDALPGFLSSVCSHGGVELAFLPFAAFALRKRRRALSILGLFALTGCSSQYPARAPAGTYQIQVVSQAASSSSAQTIPLTLIVTN